MSAYEKALDSVRASILKNNLISKGDRVLCALSGGADSASLLVFLDDLAPKLGFCVSAAHYNHGIRGEEADRDERYCEELCKAMGIPFCSEKGDVPKEAGLRGMGLEECARKMRYDFLYRVADRLSCNVICTAHHADDNIETVLLHMIRGTGLDGLTGIAPKRGMLVRPMLLLKKTEIIAALAEKGISYVHDSTNDETDCTRNYIRHNILPHIYEINPSADKAFARMTESVSDDRAFMDRQASVIPQNASRDTLKNTEAPILARYISGRYESVAGKGRRPDSRSVKELISALKSDKSTACINLSGNISAYIDLRGVYFKRTDAPSIPEFSQTLFEGENIISPIGYKVVILTDKKVAQHLQNIYNLSILWSVNFDKISKDGKIEITVRGKKGDERLRFGGMERDVRRQLIKHKVPAPMREGLPCFYVNDTLFGVAGLPVSDEFRASGTDKAAYILIINENKY